MSKAPLGTLRCLPPGSRLPAEVTCDLQDGMLVLFCRVMTTVRISTIKSREKGLVNLLGCMDPIGRGSVMLVSEPTLAQRCGGGHCPHSAPAACERMDCLPQKHDH